MSQEEHRVSRCRLGPVGLALTRGAALGDNPLSAEKEVILGGHPERSRGRFALNSPWSAPAVIPESLCPTELTIWLRLPCWWSGPRWA